MKLDIQPMVKSLSPRFVSKAIRTFDRATSIVVGACWGGAVLMMVLAVYAVMLSANSRHAAEAAAASEPILPKIVSKPIDPHDAKALLDRMQHRFPDLTFSVGNDQSLVVSAGEGAKFREWLTVIGYVDTISPKYRWTIKEFCVGKCGNAALMHAVLSGEKVSFEAPQPK